MVSGDDADEFVGDEIGQYESDGPSLAASDGDFGDWHAGPAGHLGGAPSPSPSSSPDDDKEPDDVKEEEPRVVIVPSRFAAPVLRRHRKPKFDWENNPFLPRIHAICVQHLVFFGSRVTHTESTIKCLSEPGLGPSALTDAGKSMLASNTTDFRQYLEETIPRTKTSQFFLIFWCNSGTFPLFAQRQQWCSCQAPAT